MQLCDFEGADFLNGSSSAAAKFLELAFLLNTGAQIRQLRSTPKLKRAKCRFYHARAKPSAD